MSPRLGPILACAALMLLPVACGGTGVSKVLDATATGGQISDDLVATLAVSRPAVSCPSGVKVKAHKTFDCHTAVDGQPLTVHVTMTDDQGHLTTTPGAAVIIVAKIAASIQTNEAKATVRCGPNAVLVKQPHDTFTCTAATASGPVTYRVTVQDLAGRVRYEPVPAQAG
jgi:Tfp pilus assembly protein FimT